MRTKCKLLDNCKKGQNVNPNIRYQLRLGNKDIELWTKISDEYYYHKTLLNVFGDISTDSNEFSPPHPRSKQTFSSKRMRSESPDKPNKTSRNDEDMDDDDISTILEEALINTEKQAALDSDKKDSK